MDYPGPTFTVTSTGTTRLRTSIECSFPPSSWGRETKGQTTETVITGPFSDENGCKNKFVWGNGASIPKSIKNPLWGKAYVCLLAPSPTYLKNNTSRKTPFDLSQLSSQARAQSCGCLFNNRLCPNTDRLNTTQWDSLAVNHFNRTSNCLFFSDFLTVSAVAITDSVR